MDGFVRARIDLKKPMDEMVRKREQLWYYALTVSGEAPAGIILADIYQQCRYALYFTKTCLRKEDELHKYSTQQAILNFAQQNAQTINQFLAWIVLPQS